MIFKTFMLAMIGVLYLTYQVARKRFGENKAKLFIFTEIMVTVIQGIAMYIGLTA